MKPPKRHKSSTVGSRVMHKCCFLIVLLTHGSSQSFLQSGKLLRPWLLDGPPRFKQNQRVVHEVFLNDKAIFKCTAVARPAPKIHWYRNGEFLNYSMLYSERLRANDKHFSLEIKRVEVGDQGSWACKVWNQAGSIFRNFTLEIIDFCDYFLMQEYPPKNVPEKCICLWYFTGEYKKDGIDWNAVNDVRCEPYKTYATELRKPLGKRLCADRDCSRSEKKSPISATESPLNKEEPPSNAAASRPSIAASGVLEGVDLHESESTSSTFLHDMIGIRVPPPTSSTDNDDAAAKRLRTRTLLHSPLLDKTDKSQTQDGEPIESSRSTENWAHDQSKVKSSSVTSNSESRKWHRDNDDKKSSSQPVTSTPMITPRLVTRLNFPLPKVAPYFKVRDEDATTSVITPSGRTIKLQCKAGGQPEPQVIWFNNHNKVITAEVRRPVGSEFRLRKNTLEIEDVAESDSGEYTCEAFNSAGSVTRKFRLRVVDRIRSKPIIVPNILINQTVDANSTVNFTCKVISDLVPHIVWMRIEKTNDSVIYWNETDRKYMFRYTDMQTVENAIITKTSQDSSTLTLVNVSLADQGMYACVSGNHLGHAIENATLTVNEFHAMTIATGDPESEWSSASIVSVLILLVLLSLIVLFAFLYVFCVRNKSKAQIAQMGQLIGPVKKRVIITKRTIDPEEADGWSDMPSTYQIHIEPIATSGRRRPRLSSDLTFSTDYEIPPDPAWEVDRSRLQLTEMLGEGAFGEVWKGILKPALKIGDALLPDGDSEEIFVAVKKLKSTAHEKELIDLVSEMETFKIIGHHENLLRLIGCCTGSGPLYVILELCKHGNLRDFLRAHRPRDADSGSRGQDSPESETNQYLEPRKSASKSAPSISGERVLIPHLTQRHLVQFAWQVAKGMEFMASRKIIHRDLAARNVLVADDFVMKISDFGLSRDIHYNNYYRKKGNGRLPIKWMALEALDSHVYTIYSDVWSFGILLWEIMTLGGTPYPSIAMQQLYSCLKEGYRMEAPDNCPDEIYDVMVACWQEKPENRPSFDTLVDYFDWMLTQSAQEQENYLEVQSVVDGFSGGPKNNDPSQPFNEATGLLKRCRIRPLSEPIICPSEPTDDSESELENDSTPLLSCAKPATFVEQTSMCLSSDYRSEKATAVVSKKTHSPLGSANKVDRTATISVDSAIGSPSWPISANDMVLNDDDVRIPYSTQFVSSDDPNMHPEMSQSMATSHLNGDTDSCNPCSSFIDSTESLKNSSRKEESKDDSFVACRMPAPHYINIADNEAEKGQIPSHTYFPFIPGRRSRFSDSSTYEQDSVQLSMLNSLNEFNPSFTSTNSSIRGEKDGKQLLECGGCDKATTNGDVNDKQRRLSTESSSSGRGGSSGMSSAEGLGGSGSVSD
ncbi:hypothetical protein AB6A40_002071 [Gnathostoma spinigerum]|uniref:Receptor protein-tyrosine kinase n=1 Tax=Gnathostoma spinigerum TaxID=75299 RepID=A0ABD6EFB8_9BILA